MKWIELPTNHSSSSGTSQRQWLGGLMYMCNVAYGVGKEACDRMAADCGFELNVAFVSLWPGPVSTEIALSMMKGNSVNQDIIKHTRVDLDQVLEMFQAAETPEFSGQCVAALATDTNLLEMPGTILLTYELGKKYALTDQPGHLSVDLRSLKGSLLQNGHTWIASLIPAFLRVPKWIFVQRGNKFY